MKRKLLILGIILTTLVGCATAQTAQVQAPPAKKAFGPIGERYVLDNGMVLLVKENHALPVVTVNMIIKAGAVMEPAEKNGLAHLTAGLLTKGAAGKSATEISEAIEFVGGSLSTGGGMDYSSAGLTVLRKDVETGFSLLSGVLTQPAFDQAEIDRLKKSVKAGIIRGEQEPEVVASKAFAKAVFGEGHPYGRPVEGTVKSVDGITRDDIRSFHDRLYAPNNAIMAVVGDITAGEAKALVEKYMKGWAKKDVPAPAFPVVPEPKGVQMAKVDRDISQANILMGHPGIRRDDPDYYSLYIMNYILGGGGFVSRLLDKIRDDMGLAYDVHSYFSANKFGGSFQVGMETKNKTAKTAIDEADKIIERMRTEPVTDAELQDAKDYITGSFPRRMDTNSKIAELLAQVEFFNLGLDYFDMYGREINKVTKDDVLRVARKYLHPADQYVVVVGKLKEAGL